MTPTVLRCFLLPACLLLAVAPARGDEGSEQILSPYFIVKGDAGAAAAFPLKATDVRAQINGAIADVIVNQTYTNEGPRPIDARYVFPGSTRAAVHGMTITVDDEVVTAKIKQREEAKQEFETARAQGKSASLLEQQRPNVFTMSVANIMPGDEVVVSLHYTELLVPEDGTYEFVYPTVVAPRYAGQGGRTAAAPRWEENPYVVEPGAPQTAFDIEVVLSTALPLHDVVSATHAVDVAWQGHSMAEVHLADPADFGGDRDYILKYRLAGQEIQSGLSLYEGEDENFFLLMVQPPERIDGLQIPPREYIFILDVSGSMGGFPLDTAKALISDLIAGLRPTDLFNIVMFAGGSRVMAPESLPAIEENIAQALWVIDNEQGGGGTELVPALRTALALPRDDRYVRTIAVITDGLVVAEQETFALIRGNLKETNVFSFGIGSSVNRHLIEGIARAGQGEPFVVTEAAEAPDTAARFRDYIGAPVLTNIGVSFRGFDAYDVEPQVVPDLFASRPILLMGKYRGRRSGEIEVSGMRATGPYVQRFHLKDARPQEENSALRALWARQTVARLSDDDALGTSREIVSRITSLGLTYSLLTRFTSFVAVVETVRNPEGAADGVTQPLALARGLSVGAVGYASGSEPDLPVLLLLVAAMFFAYAVLRFLLIG